jgi:hypothetical protein
MNSERDTTRIVRSWLEAGSNGIPDRVLDAVLAELPSTPQRRSRWSPWRSQTMNAFIKIGAVAAVVLLAVVVGSRFLPGGANVGGPAATSSPAPSATLSPFGGQFTFAGDISVDVDATRDGSTLSGTVVGVFNGETFRITLQCLRQFDAETWILAGELTQSADPNVADGSWGSLIVRDGSPQQAGIWTEAQTTADDCEEFVRGIPDNAVEGFEMIGPMNEGGITLPASLE